MAVYHFVCLPSSPHPKTPEYGDEEDDDDDFYATHVGAFITLAPPLPPSFSSQTRRALHRESVILPARAPPPPPITIITSHPHSYTRKAPCLNYSRPTSLFVRPPPPTQTQTPTLRCSRTTRRTRPSFVRPRLLLQPRLVCPASPPFIL
jgi:hypothetical protein